MRPGSSVWGKCKNMAQKVQPKKKAAAPRRKHLNPPEGAARVIKAHIDSAKATGSRASANAVIVDNPDENWGCKQVKRRMRKLASGSSPADSAKIANGRGRPATVNLADLASKCKAALACER